MSQRSQQLNISHLVLKLRPSHETRRAVSYSPSHLGHFPVRRLSWTTPKVEIRDSSQNLYESPRFRTLINDIYVHLTQETSRTREHFEAVTKRVNEVNPNPNYYKGRVAEYFSESFPSIQLKSWEDDLNENHLKWGMVDPSNASHICLRESMVLQFEQETDDEKRSMLSLILLVVIFHELSHSLTQHIFGASTPFVETLELGDDPRNHQLPRDKWLGESGFVVEQSIFGFKLLVEWRLADRGKMDKIHRLIAMGEDGGTRIIGSQNAREIVDSLCKRHLQKVIFRKLLAARADPEHYVRHRQTHSFTNDPTLRGDDTSDVFVRTEVPFGRDWSDAMSESDILCGCRFRSRMKDAQVPSDTDFVREHVTGGNRCE